MEQDPTYSILNQKPSKKDLLPQLISAFARNYYEIFGKRPGVKISAGAAV